MTKQSENAGFLGEEENNNKNNNRNEKINDGSQLEGDVFSPEISDWRSLQT